MTLAFRLSRLEQSDAAASEIDDWITRLLATSSPTLESSLEKP